jgi:2-polyprenyl-3-methyl-5-hydroxy-6-metoxy-1,4-benzoquinol methylase
VAEYHGIDFSSEFIEEARRRQVEAAIRNASFHCESITDFCGTHQHGIDRFFALDFTEHVADEDLIIIGHSIRQSLRKHGRLYIHTPNLRFFVELLKDKGILRQFSEHVAVRDVDRYVTLLHQVGFREVRAVYLPHYLPALSWLHALSSIPIAGSYFKARLFLDCVA